jgi:hypothetical protein
MPVFLIFIPLGVDILPTFAEPKLTDCGAAEILGGAPFPKSFTLTVGFLASLEEILKTALFLPNGVVGANVTVMMHELCAGTVEQLFVWMNSN